MENVFAIALDKVVTALNAEKIDYMIVGGFAVSYHNRTRTTNDIDLIIQIYPHHVGKILNHFPQWKGFEDAFKYNSERGIVFNITDWSTAIRYDFMTFQNDDYSWNAFERRQKVSFLGVDCYIASKEDLILSKLQWYNISPSEKQLEDIIFLVLDKNLNKEYLRWWIFKLKIKAPKNLLNRIKQ